MDKKIIVLSVLLLSFSCSAAGIGGLPNDTASLVLGEQHNFTFGESSYVMLLVGITSDSATFIVSGIRVGPGMNETKIIDLTNDGKGDVAVTLGSIMPNSTASVTVSYGAEEGTVCKPINDRCAALDECCVGKCLGGVCNYPPSVAANATENVDLDAPADATLGQTVRLRITRGDGSAVAGAMLDVLTPSELRLTLSTNENGEGEFLAAQEGVYNYVVYDYVLNSNKTTNSSRYAPPAVLPPTENNTQPPQPLCGDGNCDLNENCSICSKDCGTCVEKPVQPPTPEAKGPDTSWPLWLGLMFVVIIFILRGVLPVFIKEE